jgi:hypothetical protein
MFVAIVLARMSITSVPVGLIQALHQARPVDSTSGMIAHLRWAVSVS